MGASALVAVLQVTLSAVPTAVFAVCCTMMSLFAVTAVVLTWQDDVADVEHENRPATAPAQDATDGWAAVPTPAQLPLVRMLRVVNPAVKDGEVWSTALPEPVAPCGFRR